MALAKMRCKNNYINIVFDSTQKSKEDLRINHPMHSSNPYIIIVNGNPEK